MKELENRLSAFIYNNINELCSRQEIWETMLNVDPSNEEVLFKKYASYNKEDVKTEVTITEIASTSLYYAFEVLGEVSGRYEISQKDAPATQAASRVIPKALKLRLWGETKPGQNLSSGQIPCKLELISSSDQVETTLH